MHFLCISNAPRPNLVAVMKVSFFNTDVNGEKQLIFCTLILKIIDRTSMNLQLIVKIHNDLLNICLAFCIVLN